MSRLTVRRGVGRRPPPHKCPALGCTVWVALDKLACNTHWYALPEPMREEIRATYRRDNRRQLQLVVEATRFLQSPVQREG
ncbi:MAG: hypothetical protein LC640_09475 [Frankia sp.]|nr:hypothetical protein [Frankia sp.]